jgi:hypothetical protein
VVSLLPEDLKGRVVDRTTMFTVLREESGATLMIPNNLFFQKIFRVDENRENRKDAAVSNTYAGDCRLVRANETRPPVA